MRGTWRGARFIGSWLGLPLAGLVACSRPAATEPPDAPPSTGEERPVPREDGDTRGDSGAPVDPGLPEEGGGASDEGTPDTSVEREPDPFELRGSAELLLSPEGYYATALSVARDGTFVLTPGSLGPDGGRFLHLGRYTLGGQRLWDRTLSGNLWAGQTWLATSEEGDISLWANLGYGGDFGAGPEPRIDYGLARYSADGRFLWVREASCDMANPQADASGAVTVVQWAGCQSEGPTDYLRRFTVSGEQDFGALVYRELRLTNARHVVSPRGMTLVGGLEGYPGSPKWIQLGTDGAQLAAGLVRGVSGNFVPLQLTDGGQYLALLTDVSGSGSFAGRALTCQRDERGWCTPYLLSGDVTGHEESAVPFSQYEWTLWASPSRELVTVTLDEAGTGSLLRKRSSDGRLLGTLHLASSSPRRPEGPNVQVAQVAPLPDGTLLVLGTLVGKAQLGGGVVKAEWSRLFLLRVRL
jgi:hypothetical protein